MKKLVTHLSRLLAISLLMPYASFAADTVKSTDEIVAENLLDQFPIDLDTKIKESTVTEPDTEAVSVEPETVTSEDLSVGTQDAELPENPLQSTITAIDKTKEPVATNTPTVTKNALTDSQSDISALASITQEAPANNNPIMVEFNYTNEDIINIVNTLAAKKGVNVIVPLGAQALTNKVTFSLPNRITLDAAWSFLQTFLDISGYGMVPRGNLYYITKKNGSIAKEALPLYIVKPEDLPNTDERIRYIYYLSNIKVTDAPDSELSALLDPGKGILPQDASFKLDPASNGIIISARAMEIKALMAIITKLDKVGFLEKFDILHLRFTSAKDVAATFNDFLLKTDSAPNPYRLDTKKMTDATYFSKFTRIIADERTNSLIILGRFQAIERIKDFIRQYIDIKIEGGKSPIHVYSLQYLQAEVIAKTLTDILLQDTGAGTGQSEIAGATKGGTQRQFGDVKILSDSPQAAQAGKDTTAPQYYGGNKLIVACSSDDWKEIERLIQNLDQPRSQVLIEVFIADLTLDDLREIGTSIRNPGKIPLPGNLNFQTTNLGNTFITDGTSPNQTLKADLLKTSFPVPEPPITFAGQETKGSMVISFNDSDGRVWGVADILQSFGAQKVLSAPHIITTNNQKATISRSQLRLLPGQGTSNIASTVNYEWANADLTVEITPRISENNNEVNMQITTSINEFRDTTDNPDPERPVRTTRLLTANATVSDNNILVLGGLVGIEDSTSSYETPLLGKIPILGWFFKSRDKIVAKKNLTIFIKPIIISPRLRGGLENHTQEFLGYIDNYKGKNATFSSLKDPITRMFFANDNQAGDMIDDFLRFKQEEIAKTQEAPVQHIDLSDGSSMIEKKKSTPSETGDATPHKTEADVKRTEDRSARSEQAKKLLKDEKSLSLKSKKNPDSAASPVLKSEADVL